jgi:hypothetical protein
MEDFISLSEIEMMCTKGGVEETTNGFDDYVMPPYGVVIADYGIVIADYGILPPAPPY